MTTKRQHLVWRKYLSSWTDTPETPYGKIFVYDKSTNEIRRNNISDVAVEKYTYDISGRSQADEELCKKYLNDWFSKSGLLINANNFVFIEGNNEKDFIENKYISKIESDGLNYLNKLKNEQFPFSDENKLLENIKLFQQNLIYTLLTGQSMLSESKTDYLVKQTLELSKEKDERLSFFEFFANQFLRTNRGRKSVLDATESTKNKFPEVMLYQKTTPYLFPLMMCCNTLIISYSLWKGDFYLEMLLNKTSVNFITSDEPIINLCVDYKNTSSEQVSDMILYYPVSPKIALLCKHGNRKNEKRYIKETKEIRQLNLKMFDAVSGQVFSLCKDDFKELTQIN